MGDSREGRDLFLQGQHPVHATSPTLVDPNSLTPDLLFFITSNFIKDLDTLFEKLTNASVAAL